MASERTECRAGCRNAALKPEPRQDAELRAVGMTVSDEHRAGSTAGSKARTENRTPGHRFSLSVVPYFYGMGIRILDFRP
ncbi:MAG: hypothetical protein ACOY40_12520 [Bacillota bacterium]